LNETFEAAL